VTTVHRIGDRITIDVHLPSDWARGELRQDVLQAFTNTPRVMPPKWLYDERGSALFDAITRLPEYYQTEAEREILRRRAADVARHTGADTVVELGSGTSDKTRTLLDAFWSTGQLRRFVPLDVAEGTLVDAATRLAGRYPGLEVNAVVGDFARHLDHLPGGGRRVVAFLGGTVGNFYRQERAAFLASLADALDPGEWFLLGVDLVKSIDRMVAAYHDPGGVTADFIRNGLRVVNNELGADFDVEAFGYVAFWDPLEERMDLRLRASRPQRVRIAELGLEVELGDGEEIRAEVSTKFRLDPLAGELAAAGFEARARWTDPAGDFGMVLAERR
jgi:L-histidine N-alpha-methyltransferase